MNIVPPAPRGRGARSNASGRFEAIQRTPAEDRWDDDDPPALRTTTTALAPKSIITYNDSPDLSFDRTANPYKGCEHGCVYCYARPGHAYLGLSPGLDFESRLFFKPNAAALLEAALADPKYKPAPLVLGGDTDIYQPIERRLAITRALIEVLGRTKHPFGFVTKSALALRDLDLLAPLAKAGLCKAAVSITTLDPALARAMEPRAATPRRRLETIRGLSEAGVPVRVMLAPVIPGLNDHEIETILETAKDAGASGAGWVLLRLPHEIKDLFAEWLAEARPNAAKKVMSLIRQTRAGQGRDGAVYDARFFERGRGSGPIADLIAKRFAAAARRLELDQARAPLRTDLFRRPARPGDSLDLFDPPVDPPLDPLKAEP